MSEFETVEKFGISYPGYFHNDQSLEFASNFQFRDDDIIIASYPRSGISLFNIIVDALLKKKYPESFDSLCEIPMLEHTSFQQYVDQMPSPRVFTTRLSHEALKDSLAKSLAKVIYIYRDPRDVCVSYYYYHKMVRSFPKCTGFDQFVKDFLNGDVMYGSWFDHFSKWTSDQETFTLMASAYYQLYSEFETLIESLCKFLNISMTKEELDAVQQEMSLDQIKLKAAMSYDNMPSDIINHHVRSTQYDQCGIWSKYLSTAQDIAFIARSKSIYR
ncbi:putative sulfotransferase-like protein [Namao virus]|nr:putative sulfotransferase-like protein [Namao virus]